MCLTVNLIRGLPKSQNLCRIALGPSLLRLNSRGYNSTPRLQIKSGSSRGSSNPKVRKYLQFLGIGFGIGAFASGGYLYQMYKKISVAVPNSSKGEEYFLEEPPPKQKLARSIQVPEDRTGLKITLYQFQTCPFCCKVRAFLDYYGFSYDVVEVNSVTHKQTKWTSYRKVPFLVIEQEGVEKVMQLKDSSMIISAMRSFLVNKSEKLEDIVKGYPLISYNADDGTTKTEIMNRYFLMYGPHTPEKTKDEMIHERKWRKWVDDVYVHTLSPNVYRTMDESFQAFSWFSEVGNWGELFATWERLLVVYVGSVAMYLIGKRLKKRHHLKDDVRLSFYEETNIWLKEVKNRGGKFAGGDEPNLSDLAVFGVLTAIEGCDAFKELMQNTKLLPWFTNMNEEVTAHKGAKYLAQRGPNRV